MFQVKFTVEESSGGLLPVEGAPRLPGSLLMSQLSCFLEMLVQLRSRAAGCLRMMPLSMRGVMDLQRFRLMSFQSLLSQHLWARVR